MTIVVILHFLQKDSKLFLLWNFQWALMTPWWIMIYPWIQSFKIYIFSPYFHHLMLSRTFAAWLYCAICRKGIIKILSLTLKIRIESDWLFQLMSKSDWRPLSPFRRYGTTNDHDLFGSCCVQIDLEQEEHKMSVHLSSLFFWLKIG